VIIAIPDKLRRPIKWVGYPLFALFTFMLSVYFTLPRERIKDRLISDAQTWLNLDLDVKDGDFGLTLFTGPGVTASPVIAKTRPATPSEKPARLLVDDVTVHFGLFSALRGFADTSFSGHAAGGAISGRYKSVPDEGLIVIDTSGVQIGKIPIISSPSGIPIDGAVDLKADLTAPKNMIPQASGSASLDITDATVGDGNAKLSIPGGDPFLSQGITLPKIALGKISGSLAVDKGRATFRDLKGHSKDVDIELEGYIELRDPIAFSLLHLYLKFKPSDALVKREATIELMNNMLGTLAKRADGYLGFSITGSLNSPLFLPSKEPPPGLNVKDVPAAPVAKTAPPTPLPTPPRPSALPPGTTMIDVPSAAPPPPPPVAAPTPPLPTAPPDPPGAPPPPAVGAPPAVAAPANAIPPRYNPNALRAADPTATGTPTGAPPGGEEGTRPPSEGKDPSEVQVQ
jgi:type II secretion system protein N